MLLFLIAVPAKVSSKGKILDELCHVYGYNWKYAIWKLSQLPMEDKPKVRAKRRRPRKYGHKVLKILEAVWEAANYPWFLRLKEIMSENLSPQKRQLSVRTRLKKDCPY